MLRHRPRQKHVLWHVVDDRKPRSTNRTAELCVGGPVLGATDEHDRYVCVPQGPTKHRLIFAGLNPPGLHHKLSTYACVLAKRFWIGIKK